LHELLVEQGQSDYLPYSGVLPFELASTNNRLQRAVGHHDKPTGIVHSIENGIVIDHLSSSANVDAILQPEARLRPDRKIHLGAYGKFPDAHGGVKTVYKTDLPELTERELRSIALASPGATINVIREGRVIDKFVYVLCGNENCVTRVVEEAVPAKLYAEDGHAHCRYCRKPVEIPSRKVTAEERAAFIASLPTRIEPIVYR
jgi:aspartate carbamoyltransferase regulatory subunit